MLRIVAATTLDEKGFKSRSPLALSAARAMGRPGISLQIAYKNANPLARPFNNAIATLPEDDVLLFTHDDVSLDDWFLPSGWPRRLAGSTWWASRATAAVPRVSAAGPTARPWGFETKPT